MSSNPQGDPGTNPVPPAAAPHQVRVPVNVHHWDNISFLHWPIATPELTGLLPDELEVLTYDGSAWVGVTPFFIQVRPPGVPVTPPGWAFPETNVRTYVRGPDGRLGLWFLHMEVTARWFVATMRTLALPYVHREMSVEADDERITYTSKPSDGTEGGHHIVVRPGAPMDPPEGGSFERFLTAWWGAYHRPGPLLHTPVEHPTWRLQAAEVDTCEVGGLFRAAGLGAPEGEPVAHFSAGVPVKVGPPRPVT